MEGGAEEELGSGKPEEMKRNCCCKWVRRNNTVWLGCGLVGKLGGGGQGEVSG